MYTVVKYQISNDFKYNLNTFDEIKHYLLVVLLCYYYINNIRGGIQLIIIFFLICFIRILLLIIYFIKNTMSQNEGINIIPIIIQSKNR